ncbi:MAG: FMN-binding protein [Lachnospira pectinoschiza]
MSETAGLGMRAKQDPSFLAQFNGTKTSEYKVVTDGTGSSSDSYIDAIGGSTVTSKAITKGVNAALAVYADLAKANVKTVGGVSVE